MWLWYLDTPYIKAPRLGKILSSPHIGSGTWKNSELHPMYRLWLWGLEERNTERGEVRVVVYLFLPI